MAGRRVAVVIYLDSAGTPSQELPLRRFFNRPICPLGSARAGLDRPTSFRRPVVFRVVKLHYVCPQTITPRPSIGMGVIGVAIGSGRALTLMTGFVA